MTQASSLTVVRRPRHNSLHTLRKVRDRDGAITSTPPGCAPQTSPCNLWLNFVPVLLFGFDSSNA